MSKGTRRWLDIGFCHLDSPIHPGLRDVIIRTPCGQHRSITPHQVEGQPLEEVAGGGLLLLASVPGQSCGQLLHLLHSNLVHTSQGFHSQGVEGYTLVPASLSSAFHFPLKGLAQGISGLSGSRTLAPPDISSP